jgi:hypothetical protein
MLETAMQIARKWAIPASASINSIKSELFRDDRYSLNRSSIQTEWRRLLRVRSATRLRLPYRKCRNSKLLTFFLARFCNKHTFHQSISSFIGKIVPFRNIFEDVGHLKPLSDKGFSDWHRVRLYSAGFS